jgi:pimeloyl-ACP methyl ester carboxylesterase
MIDRFRIEIAPAVFDDFRSRLRAARWPSGVLHDGGLPVSEMRAAVRHALDTFDWPTWQDELNRLPHFTTECGGLRLHLLHLKSPRSGAVPLLLVHGWPGSFIEMLSMAPLLSDAFDVVIPSLPGFGFSEIPTAAGVSNARIAALLAELMSKLGYERFAVQGGDWGAGIATWLARRFPARVIAIHLNYVPGSYAPFVEAPLSPEEEAFLRDRAEWIERQAAYGHVQSTRPLTLAYALSDSPIGLIAWILEKFREWADPDRPIPLDPILANIFIYWATNTIPSSMRLYLESAQTPLRFVRGDRVGVPCGIARFPHEAPFPPSGWIERAYDVVHWTAMPYGGHFAAMEAPELLAADVRAFLSGRT